MREKEDRGWSPYLAGALTGLLMVASVWLSGHYFGASTTFVRYAGYLEKLVAPERVAGLAYFVKIAPTLDWQFFFLLGILVGSFLSATLFGDFRLEAVPPMWAERFGPSAGKRALVAFVGGMVAIFGARLADGCPSGHGLSGVLQLAVSGFISLICFFLGGLVVARLLYGGRRMA